MEQCNKKHSNALDDLFDQVGTYKNGNDFTELLEFAKRFPYIAPYNAFLLQAQKPGAVYVAAVELWHKHFNRRVKVGARPLVILVAFGPVRFVFELEDTEGDEPFPDSLLKPFKVDGSIEPQVFSRLINNFVREGIAYSEVDHGTESAGFIQGGLNGGEQFVGKKKVKILYHIVVNKNHSIEEKFATLVHELGHLFCGHLGTPDRKLWESRREYSHEIQEFEAESVAWLVCERAGLKNPSAKYLSGYLDQNGNIPLVSVDTILKVTGKIESMMQGVVKFRKEIVLSDSNKKKYLQQALF